MEGTDTCANTKPPSKTETCANTKPQQHLGAHAQLCHQPEHNHAKPQHQPEHNHPPEVHLRADICADTSSSTDTAYVRPMGPCRWIFRACYRRIFARSAPQCSPSSDTAMNFCIGPCSDSLISQPAQRDPSPTWAYHIGCIVPARHGHTA